MKSGAATVEIHPISFLDRSSLGTRYSSRAANAGGCVANYSPNDYWAFTQEMYEKQPTEDTAGLTNAQIVSVIKKAGVHHIPEITKCVDTEKFKSWVTAATNRATTGPLPDANVKTVTGTPTVIVDGLQYNANGTEDWTSASAFAAFVVQAAGASFNSGSTSTSTPTPSPTPTK
jgi:protein-disulfide isomerase